MTASPVEEALGNAMVTHCVLPQHDCLPSPALEEALGNAMVSTLAWGHWDRTLLPFTLNVEDAFLLSGLQMAS